jgi:hypothetical protein
MNNPSKIQTNESPYSSYYSEARDPYASNQSQNTYSNTSYTFDTKKDLPGQNNQFNSISNPQDKNEISTDEDVMTHFIEKAKQDMNILPTEYRNKIKTYNNIFVASSCIYPVYFLFNFLKDYPEINAFSKRNLILSTGLYFGLLFMLNSMSNRNYQQSYHHLRSQYSEDQLRNMIDQYHDINRQNLKQRIDGSKDEQ